MKKDKGQLEITNVERTELPDNLSIITFTLKDVRVCQATNNHPVFIKSSANEHCKGQKCFSSGTLILTKSGEFVPIEKIEQAAIRKKKDKLNPRIKSGISKPSLSEKKTEQVKRDGRIVINPSIRCGRMCINGTRIALDDLVGYFNQGDGDQHIKDTSYPHLTIKEIANARRFLWEYFDSYIAERRRFKQSIQGFGVACPSCKGKGEVVCGDIMKRRCSYVRRCSKCKGEGWKNYKKAKKNS